MPNGCTWICNASWVYMDMQCMDGAQGGTCMLYHINHQPRLRSGTSCAPYRNNSSASTSLSGSSPPSTSTTGACVRARFRRGDPSPPSSARGLRFAMPASRDRKTRSRSDVLKSNTCVNVAFEARTCTYVTTILRLGVRIRRPESPYHNHLGVSEPGTDDYARS